jgi:glucosyl-3-phosphoglycerate synthase
VYHPPAVAPDPTSWFARRTFHHTDFVDPSILVDAKREQNLTVSVCIPALNEATTIGPIVERIRKELMDAVPLVDDLAVIDSASSDRTVDASRAAGAVVYQDREILPELEPLSGKGEALWKSLFVLRGDLLLWLDADIRNFDPRFVYGPLGPLLLDPTVDYVKSFYRRPMGDGTETTLEGGRVTELVARPILNMFWPQLAGLVQPLSGEYAGRRTMLEQIPFFTGYGVEIGMLIDIADRYGVEAMAQVDLEERVHRNRPIGDLSRMAFAVLHTALRRLASDGRLEANLPPRDSMFQFEDVDGASAMRATPIEVRERPPAISVAGYAASR